MITKDIIIVGQGIAGSALAWHLLKNNKKIIVIDLQNKNIASKIAGGLYNPITGRSFQKTWFADTIFPYMEKFYKEIENITNSRILYPKTILKPFWNLEEFKRWDNCNDLDDNYIEVIENHENRNLKYQFGGIKISNSGYVDINIFLEKTKNKLIELNSYLEKDFEYNLLKIDENEIIYKNIIAEKIIFCEGIHGCFNPFFKNLPFKAVKGDVLEGEISKQINLIYNREIFLLQNHENKIIIGSTYNRIENLNNLKNEINNLYPNKNGSIYLKDKVINLFDLEVNYKTHKTGIRPCTIDRKPFVGFHSKYKNIGILNGLGTKGVSLGPFMAKVLVNKILNKQPIQTSLNKQIDIKRKNCEFNFN